MDTILRILMDIMFVGVGIFMNRIIYHKRGGKGKSYMWLGPCVLVDIILTIMCILIWI